VSWASEHAQSLFAAVDGELHGDGITVAVTAIDVAGPVFAASDDMPAELSHALACLLGWGAAPL